MHKSFIFFAKIGISFIAWSKGILMKLFFNSSNMIESGKIIFLSTPLSIVILSRKLGFCKEAKVCSARGIVGTHFISISYTFVGIYSFGGVFSWSIDSSLKKKKSSFYKTRRDLSWT